MCNVKYTLWNVIIIVNFIFCILFVINPSLDNVRDLSDLKKFSELLDPNFVILLPGLSWPSTSAVLPFFTFSIRAPMEPSSNSLPPTTFSPSILLQLPEPADFRKTMWPIIFWPSSLTCQDNGCYGARIVFLLLIMGVTCLCKRLTMRNLRPNSGSLI